MSVTDETDAEYEARCAAECAERKARWRDKHGIKLPTEEQAFCLSEISDVAYELIKLIPLELSGSVDTR